MRESYENDLKKAMHLYAQKLAEEFPADESVSDITFSPSFERKMQKEVRRRKHGYFRVFNTAAKRVAAAAAVLVLLLSFSLSVDAIRTPLTNLTKTFFYGHVDLGFEGDKNETIAEIYGITFVPEGFELTRESISSTAVFLDYADSEGNEISFSQMITDYSSNVHVDTEHTTTQSVDVNGMEVFVARTKTDDIVASFWATDGYSFNLTYFGVIEDDLLFEMIESIQVVGTYTE